MGDRRRWTPERVRQRIQTANLVTALQKHVRGQIKMSATQVNAAQILLKKTLPDLSTVEHTGEIRNRDVTDQPLSAEQWEQQYSEPASH